MSFDPPPRGKTSPRSHYTDVDLEGLHCRRWCDSGFMLVYQSMTWLSPTLRGASLPVGKSTQHPDTNPGLRANSSSWGKFCLDVCRRGQGAGGLEGRARKSLGVLKRIQTWKNKTPTAKITRRPVSRLPWFIALLLRLVRFLDPCWELDEVAAEKSLAQLPNQLSLEANWQRSHLQAKRSPVQGPAEVANAGLAHSRHPEEVSCETRWGPSECWLAHAAFSCVCDAHLPLLYQPLTSLRSRTNSPARK